MNDCEPEEPEKCCNCDCDSFGYAEGFPWCVRCYQTRPSIVRAHEPTECPSCDEIVDRLTEMGVCDDCERRHIEFERRMDCHGPEDDEPDDPDATPILTDPEDPGEHLEPHKPDLGGES